MAATKRCQIPISFQYKNLSGSLIPVPTGTPVTVINRDTSASAVVYLNETGPSTIASPQTDAGGNIAGWLIEGSYLFSTTANAGASPPYAGASVAWEAVRGDGVENVAAGVVDGTALGDGVVNVNHLVAAVAQALIPSGTLIPSAASAPPTGYLLCDGTAINRSTYATLFSAIGTAYGTGDGSTTFNVPDYRGRTILGAGTGSGLTARTRGDKAGSESHSHNVPSLTVNQVHITNLPIPQLSVPSLSVATNGHNHNLDNANAYAKFGAFQFGSNKCSFTATPMFTESYASADGSTGWALWVNSPGGMLSNVTNSGATTALGGFTDTQAPGGSTGTGVTGAGAANGFTDVGSTQAHSSDPASTLSPYTVANVFIKV